MNSSAILNLMQPLRGLKKRKKRLSYLWRDHFSKPELNDEDLYRRHFRVSRVRRRVGINAWRINLGNGQCQYCFRSFTQRDISDVCDMEIVENTIRWNGE